MMVTEVDIHAFAAARADGAQVIDVREPAEYEGGHVPGARLIPLGRLATALTSLDRHRPVYVICASGNRSRSGAALLADAGFDARSVRGGTSAWISVGLATVRGERESAA